MKKISVLLLVFLCAAGLTFASGSKTPKEQAFKGTIEKFDATAKTLTLKPDKGDAKDFTFADTTTFWTKGKAVKVDDVKVGEKATVYVDPTTNAVKKVYVEPMKMASGSEKH
jgi:uncharacterized FAD-dependent dehydrogenase